MYTSLVPSLHLPHPQNFSFFYLPIKKKNKPQEFQMSIYGPVKDEMAEERGKNVCVLAAPAKLCMQTFMLRVNKQ